MAQSGIGGNGNGILLYGAIIRDKIKSASLETLMAYRTVGHDLAKGTDGHTTTCMARSKTSTRRSRRSRRSDASGAPAASRLAGGSPISCASETAR
jgi:hypothetical protein